MEVGATQAWEGGWRRRRRWVGGWSRTGERDRDEEGKEAWMGEGMSREGEETWMEEEEGRLLHEYWERGRRDDDDADCSEWESRRLGEDGNARDGMTRPGEGELGSEKKKHYQENLRERKCDFSSTVKKPPPPK